nr:FUN14 domain containing protein 1 [Hymenolepis microstoma]
MAAQQALDEVAGTADEVLGKIEKKPIAQQILIGAASGLLTGYFLTKIGKSVAFCIGVTAIGAQFFVSQRKPKSDWKKVESDAREALNRVLPSNKQGYAIRQKVGALIKENQFFFGSFGGGFLIGVSFA